MLFLRNGNAVSMICCNFGVFQAVKKGNEPVFWLLGKKDLKKFAFFSLFDDIFAFFKKSYYDLTLF